VTQTKVQNIDSCDKTCYYQRGYTRREVMGITKVHPNENIDNRTEKLPRNENGQIIIDRNRDKPPLLTHIASLVLIKLCGGEIFIANMNDSDVMKGGGKKRGIFGGRMKHLPEGGQEDPHETAAAEGFEEGGARFLPSEIHPICLMRRRERYHRDAYDQEVRGETMHELLQFVFAHTGHVALHETTDEDARNPRWDSLDDIIAHNIETSQLKRIPRRERTDQEWDRAHELEGEIWLLTHLVALLYTLQSIGKKFKKYNDGNLNDETDREFFAPLAHEIAHEEDIFATIQAVKDMADINVIGIVCQIMGEDEGKVSKIMGDVLSIAESDEGREEIEERQKVLLRSSRVADFMIRHIPEELWTAGYWQESSPEEKEKKKDTFATQKDTAA